MFRSIKRLRFALAAIAMLVALPAMTFAQPRYNEIRKIPVLWLNDIAVSAMDAYGPVIYYNPMAMAQAGPNLSTFFFAHEYGHHVLGHLAVCNTASIQQRVQMELEADAFAVRMLWRQQNIVAIQQTMMFFAMQGDQSADVAHPTGTARVAKIMATMKELRERTDP